MSVRLRINRFFRSLIETFFEREKRTYLKKYLKMPLSRHYKSGNSSLGHLHSWSGDTKFGTEIWSHNVCICYLYWRDNSIQGTLASGPEGFPWIEVVLCAFLTERMPRVSLECRGSIVCAFYRTYNLFPRQTIEEPRWTGVTVPSSQKCFHGIIKSSSEPTDKSKGPSHARLSHGAKNRAFVWYRAGQ